MRVNFANAGGMSSEIALVNSEQWQKWVFNLLRSDQSLKQLKKWRDGRLFHKAIAQW